MTTSASDSSYIDRDFDAFCRMHSPRLIAAMRLQTGSDAYAVELAQEALMRAWKHWPEVAQMNSPEGWLFRVAYNLAHSLRRRLTLVSRFERRTDRPTSGADETLAVELKEMLAKLPRRLRQAVVLRHLVQFSVAETAEIMGCAEGTVKALTGQGLRQLRAALEPTEGEEEPMKVAPR